MMEEDIDPGDHHTREMYARYGLAMYFAQVIEAGIKNALVMGELADAQFATIEDFDVAAATNFKTVLGRLIEKFKPFLAADEPFVDDLQLALMTRNQLAHHFFWDHAPDAMTWDGRERMMRECDAATELFQEISTRLGAWVSNGELRNRSTLRTITRKNMAYHRSLARRIIAESKNHACRPITDPRS